MAEQSYKIYLAYYPDYYAGPYEAMQSGALHTQSETEGDYTTLMDQLETGGQVQLCAGVKVNTVILDAFGHNQVTRWVDADETEINDFQEGEFWDRHKKHIRAWAPVAPVPAPELKAFKVKLTVYEHLSIAVQAESPEHAEQLARAQYADGAAFKEEGTEYAYEVVS